MNKKSVKALAVLLCAALLAGTAGMAYAMNTDEKDEPKAETATVTEAVDSSELTKDETVYVLAGSDGSVKKIIVSDWIKNEIAGSKINDKTELTDIENVKGNETYTLNSDNVTVWDAEGNDIYYQGNIDKELPVSLTISYKLDGKSVTADEIKGKSGKATIRFDYKNNQYETVNIDGKNEKIYVPFAMLTGMLLDSDTFRNIEVSNGKLINDGDRTAVVGIAFPGLQENLAIDKDKLELPDYVEITADVTDFTLGTTVTIATNEIFNEFDTSKLDNLDKITDSVNQLTDGMNQLLDGSSALYEGLGTLLDKSAELVSGINTMADGAEKLKDATVKLDDGADKLNRGATQLADGLATLESNNSKLNGGAKQIFETLLSTANTQLANAGLTVPTLTIDNYAAVLNEVISSLDSTKVYNQALEQVTRAVEANRSAVVAGVTAVVREQVAGQVIYAATNGQMTKETYDAAVSAGQIPQATQTAIESAVNAQMQSEQVQATINEQTELQIKKLISDNMASEEVQSKLAAAETGAKSVIALKASLDSYNSFYLGLLSYTDGVASAADGAATLADGTSDLKDGTSQLKDGMATLYDGILKMKDGAPALTEGVSKLKDGSMQLSEGLKKLNDEGIEKITNLVNGDVKGVVTRLKATIDVSKNYKNFSGISDDTDGQVKFIYRTDEIK